MKEPKRCYVVVGPESSGNRLLAALLVRAGCRGVAGMDTPDALPIDDDPAVVLRSYPHGYEWPDLRSIVGRLRDRGYLVRVLVTVRDHHCVIHSQQAHRLHTREVAEANVQRAYCDIFRQVADIGVGFVMVPYESLVARPVHGVRSLLEWLGLPVDNLGGKIVIDGKAHDTITDGNGRWYA